MPDIPSFADSFDAARREILVQPTRITKDVVDIEGSDANIIVAGGASMSEETSAFALALYQESFLGTAKGEALDRWVMDRYQLPRQTAQPAVVTLELTRSNTVGFTVDTDSIFSTPDGVEFSTIDDVVFASGVLGPLTVTARALTAGTGGNVPTGTVTEVNGSFDDTTLAVTNTEPAAGGSVDEEDDDYRARARGFFLSARRGTKEAIEIGARAVAGVTEATAIEVLESTGIPQFRVQLLISDENGQGNLALAQLVTLALDEFRGLGVPVLVSGAVPQFVIVEAQGLQFEAGANTTAVLNDARERVLARINVLAPGETLRLATILAALNDTDQLIVPDDALVQPAGDLIPNAGSVIRTRSDLIALNSLAPTL